MLDIDADVLALQRAIERLGSAREDGKIVVKYGSLFKETENELEALMGTLRAAKKRGFVHYEGQLLLQGVHDDVDVVLLPAPKTSEAPGAAAAVASAAPPAASTEAVAADAPADL